MRISSLLLHRAIACVLLGFSISGLALAAGDPPKVNLSIERGAALQTINQFIAQSGLQLIYDADAVRDSITAQVVGRFDAVEGLRRMFAGSGMVVDVINSRTVAIRPQRSGLTPISVLTLQTAAASASAPAAATPATAASASEAALDLQEVVVTASRVARSGFTAPTPTTVVSAADFERRAALTVADVLNELPEFRPTTSPVTNSNAGTGTGQTFVDLRGLGSVRTLTLVNGRRHVPSATTGQVDLSLIPSILIERAEVVTGGASAAWGSDAIAGVVNLLLRNELQGFESSAQYGISEQSDNQSYKIGFGGGTSFASDRGHVMVGGEFSDEDGIDGQGRADRQDWIKWRGNVTNNAFATNGQPFTIYAEDIQFANQTVGGLITGPVNAATTSLRGLAFNPDGTTYRLATGQVFGNSMIGGGQQGNNQQDLGYLKAPVQRYSLFGRAQYQLTDNLTAFVELSHANSETDSRTVVSRDGGLTAATVPAAGPTPTSLIARLDNPFLPAGIRAQMQTAGVTALYIGRSTYEIGQIDVHVENETQRAVVGVNGDLGGTGNWSWDAYYQYGQNKGHEFLSDGRRITANWRQATDVATGPGGVPICRSTLTAPNNGCVPFNIFGQGNASAAAIDYVTGESFVDTDQTQQVASLNLNGDLFSLTAGPVSLATGIEWREEKVAQAVDPITAANGFDFGNALPTIGKLDVKEAYLEVVVPLLKDLSFMRMLDLDLAGRYTDYSTSGGVETWKAGLNWDVNGQVRLRGTYSQDIRAANLNELYVSTAGGTGAFLPVDRVLGTTSPNNVLVRAVGNPSLEPEEAKTLTAGIVLQPRGLAGFRTSLDYYSIDIEGVVNRVAGQTIIDRCALGLTSYCSYISRSTGPTPFITGVDSPYLNLNRLKTSGVDWEALYARPMSVFGDVPGNFIIRMLVNYVDELVTIDALGPIDVAGQLSGTGVPHWRGSATLTYNLGKLSTSLQGQYVGGGNYDNLAKPGTNTSANLYTVPSVTSWNLSASYTFNTDSAVREWQVFGFVNNLFDVEPPFPFISGPYYDPTGRSYRLGLRMKF